MARLFAVTEPLPTAKPHLFALAESQTPQARAGDYAQALMDLGGPQFVNRTHPAVGFALWPRFVTQGHKVSQLICPKNWLKRPNQRVQADFGSRGAKMGPGF